MNKKEGRVVVRTDETFEMLLSLLVEEMNVKKSEVVRQAVYELASQKLEKKVYQKILSDSFTLR